MKHIQTLLTLGLLIVLGQIHLSAQITPAWTRQLTPDRWFLLTRSTSFKPGGKAPFISLPRVIDLKQRVKTTDYKFIYHYTAYSNIFSRSEKELLQHRKSSFPLNNLGKITYLHNKHAAFFNQLEQVVPSAVSETAFWRHQNTLEEMLAGLESYYVDILPQQLSSNVFDAAEIAKLLKGAKQPAAYLLSPNELRQFAALPSLQAQKQWVEQQIEYLQKETYSLLAKDTYTIPANQFAHYYLQNIRLDYFQTLSRVLENASTKRLSAIMRYKLPQMGLTGKWTDAQRGGFLHWKLDTASEESKAFYQQQLQEFNRLYIPYAAAEALQAPYEVALQHGHMAPELINEQEGTRLRHLSSQDCITELTPKIAQLRAQLVELRRQATPTAAFYTDYYRIYAQLEIYEALTARAHIMLNFKL